MSTVQSNTPEEDLDLIPHEMVYVAGLIILGVVFATLILSGTLF